MPGRSAILPTAFNTKGLLRSVYGDSKPKTVRNVETGKAVVLATKTDSSSDLNKTDPVVNKTTPIDNSETGKNSPEIPAESVSKFDNFDSSEKLTNFDSKQGTVDNTSSNPAPASNSDKTISGVNESKNTAIDSEDKVILLSPNSKSKSAKIINSFDGMGSMDDLEEICALPPFCHQRTVASRLPSYINDDPFTPTNSDPDENEYFPLESAAAGDAPCPTVKEAKKIESSARRKSREGKKLIAGAKFAVTEARLDEFEAKIRGRQARITERHATLCRQRAIIKQAEERLVMLEIRLKQDEEAHRKREEKIRAHERRVKQEEIKIHIQEANLIKREEKVSEQLKDIGRRKKIVEEKEMMSSMMTDIIEQKTDSFNEVTTKRSRAKSSPKETSPKMKTMSDFNDAIRRKENNMKKLTSPNNHSLQVFPILPPSDSNSSPVGENSPKYVFKRSSSFDSELVLGESTSPTNKQFNMSSLPRPRKTIMGLWL